MRDGAKESIQVVLEALRRVNMEYGVSMAMDIEEKKLIFLDTNNYLATKKFSGFAVPLESLVR